MAAIQQMSFSKFIYSMEIFVFGFKIQRNIFLRFQLILIIQQWLR